MNFAFPWALLLLPFVLLLLRKRKLKAIAVSSLADWKNAPVPRRVRWVNRLRIVRTLAAALLVIALAGPRIEKPVIEEIRQGIAIEMLVDISSSMDRSITVRDGEKSTRMEAAKTVVEAFIENRPDDLIGLITFARYADTLSPLTFGHDALIELVREIEIQDRPNEDGTAYGDALALAGAHLERMDKWNEESGNALPVETKTVILLTDGENNCGLHLPREAAGLIAAWNIRLYSISLADAENDELTDSEKLLENISEATGGRFWKIADVADLTAAYDTIDRLEKSEIKNSSVTYTEQRHIFFYFALTALILLLLEQILSATLLRITGAD
jgi:Ca-activated chloride channel homolog